MNFGLIGNGYISERHINAINKVGHKITKVYDPIACNTPPLNDFTWFKNLDNPDNFFKDLDWVVICSPSHLHYEHCKLALQYPNVQIVCEKPLVLPWQPVIDDDRLNIVLQLRWLNLPEKIKQVKCTMVRGEEYFESWKGDPLKTGGLFFSLFIHYIDLALNNDAEFIGKVKYEGKQVRSVDNIDIFDFDMDDLYFRMYIDILQGKGVKPKDIFYLNWVLNKNSEVYGYGSAAIDKEIRIKGELL